MHGTPPLRCLNRSCSDVPVLHACLFVCVCACVCVWSKCVCVCVPPLVRELPALCVTCAGVRFPGRYQEAYQGFVKLQKIQPKNDELFIAAGQAQQSMGNAEGALEEYQKAASVIDPKVLRPAALPVRDLMDGMDL